MLLCLCLLSISPSTYLSLRLEWAEVMRSVLQLDLPFLGYQPKLAELTRDGRINYTQFLDRYRIKMRAEDAQWQDGMIQAVCRKLFQSTNARDVDGAFRHFDANDDGCIEYEEFSDTLKSLDIGLDDQQIFQLMCSMDRNRDGTIDLQEFRDRFGLCFQQVQLGGGKGGHGGGGDDAEMADEASGAGATASAARLARKSSGDSIMTDASEGGEEGKVRSRMRRAQSVDPHPAARSKMVLRAQSLDDAKLQEALRDIGVAMLSFAVREARGKASKAAAAAATGSLMADLGDTTHTGTLLEVFKKYDVNGDNVLNRQEFAAALKDIGCDCDEQTASVIFDAVDTHATNNIAYEEFVEAFRVEDRNSTRPAMLEHVKDDAEAEAEGEGKEGEKGRAGTGAAAAAANPKKRARAESTEEEAAMYAMDW